MLSQWERWLITEVITSRLVRRILLGAAILWLAQWFIDRLISRWTARAADDSMLFRPTLYDPRRLQDVLRVFVANESNGTMGHRAPRHRTEAMCRALLEDMLGLPLPKCRPRFLLNPVTNRCLELDMYNEEARLAFEYDGAQHDVFTPHYHANEYHFQYRRLLDRLKSDLCRSAGVRLIRIPWREVRVSDPRGTARYLRALLRSHGLLPPPRP